MNLKKIVSRNNFFKEYISVLNGMLQLSKREAEVFSFLLAADLAGFADNVNCKTVRKIIISQLGISEANLSKYLNTIKAKDLIVRGENGKWILNDDVRIKPVENSVYITIILELEDEENKTSPAVDQAYTREDRISNERQTSV